MTLSSAELVLRPIRYRDQRQWNGVRRRNADWLKPWEATNPAYAGIPLSFADMVRRLNQQARAQLALPFSIIERQQESVKPQLIGQLTVAPIMWGSARSATLGYWVDQQHAGRGVTPTAVALATDYCFDTLRLHRMEINIRLENAPSLRVVQKLGFRNEGVRRNYLHIDGAWRDHRSFALTAGEVPEGLLNRWLKFGAVG